MSYASSLAESASCGSVGSTALNSGQDVLGTAETREARPAVPFSLSLISQETPLPEGFEMVRKDTPNGSRRGWAFKTPTGYVSTGFSLRKYCVMMAHRHALGVKLHDRTKATETREKAFLGAERPPEGYALITVEKFNPVRRLFGYGVGLVMVADWHETKVDACRAAHRHALQNRPS